MTVFHTETSSELVALTDSLRNEPSYIKNYRLKQIEASLVEQLLLFGTLAFKVEGVNLPLRYLILNIGIREVEKLVAEGVIRFVLWSPAIYVIEGERGNIQWPRNHLTPPIISGNRSDAIFTDPEESLRVSLQHLQSLGLVNESKTKDLIRKLRDRHDIPDSILASKSVEFVLELHDTDRLAGLGFPNKGWNMLTREEVYGISRVGVSILETAAMAQLSYATWDSQDHYDIFLGSEQQIKHVSGMTEDVKKIFEPRRIQNIRDHVFSGRLTLKQALQLRSSRSAEGFREWFEKVELSDSDIVDEFDRAIAGETSKANTPLAKLVRVASVSTVSGVVGSLVGATVGGPIGASIGGPVGATIGNAISAIAPDLVDVSLGIFDEFLLTKLLQGKNPRMFIKQLQEAVTVKEENTQ